MKRTQSGFTLMELLTAIAIVSILVAIATPSFRTFSANSRISATANSVVNALALARSEALRRSTPVSVCPTTNSQTCVTGTTDWSTGWLVFTDGAGAKGQLDSTDAAVQIWPATNTGVRVTMVAANGDKYVRFDPRGINDRFTTDTFTVTTLSGCVGNNASQIVLTVSGSPQTTKVACP